MLKFYHFRMSRAVPWVTAPSDIVKASIESASRKSFFILKQSGPTSFILRDGASKRFVYPWLRFITAYSL